MNRLVSAVMAIRDIFYRPTSAPRTTSCTTNFVSFPDQGPFRTLNRNPHSVAVLRVALRTCVPPLSYPMDRIGVGNDNWSSVGCNQYSNGRDLDLVTGRLGPVTPASSRDSLATRFTQVSFHFHHTVSLVYCVRLLLGQVRIKITNPRHASHS